MGDSGVGGPPIIEVKMAFGNIFFAKNAISSNIRLIPAPTWKKLPRHTLEQTR
jgi:hypothetical protein